MTGREWKPGDVAMIRVSAEYRPEIAVRGRGIFDHLWYTGGPRFGSQHGWPDGRVEVIRPLVVIDPEDREQVERLNRAQDDEYARQGIDVDHECIDVEVMQAALRSLATPPKPDEPTGLGAVVEDAEGDRWVRAESGTRFPWSRANPDGAEWCVWADIAAVRVLSDGVQP